MHHHIILYHYLFQFYVAQRMNVDILCQIIIMIAPTRVHRLNKYLILIWFLFLPVHPVTIILCI